MEFTHSVVRGGRTSEVHDNNVGSVQVGPGWDVAVSRTYSTPARMG